MEKSRYFFPVGHTDGSGLGTSCRSDQTESAPGRESFHLLGYRRTGSLSGTDGSHLATMKYFLRTELRAGPTDREG